MHRIVSCTLQSRAEHVRRVLSGSGCELWLNAEVRAALLNANLCTWQAGEDLRHEEAADPTRRPDLTVRNIHDPDSPVAVQSIEGKVLLPLAPSEIQGQLADLKRQMDDAGGRGIPPSGVIGLVYLVYQQWRCVRAGTNQRDVTMRQFVDRGFDEIVAAFGASPYAVATKKSDAIVLDWAATNVGGFLAQVGLGLVIVTR